MLNKSEVLELARLMDRDPHQLEIELSTGRSVTGIDLDMREWEVIIEALRVAAATLPDPPNA